MLYRFVCPKANGSVIDIPVAAPTLQAAFDDFMANHWAPVSTVTLGVWARERLAGYVVIEGDGPELRSLEPPEPPQSLACGD